MNRLDKFIAAHREMIRRALLVAALALPALAIVGAVLIWARVVDLGARSDAAATFLVLYYGPLFVAAPLWVRERLDLGGWARIVDGGVLVLAFARMTGGEVLPYSGHMLFLTYSLLATPISARYRLLAVALLAETTVFKLWIWRDWRSWPLGLILGLAAAFMWWASNRGRGPEETLQPGKETAR
ncbi:MAG TPA: hypothetical protein VF092_24790 [Longimicrobium sp.]